MNYYEEEDTKLDKLLLIARRIFIVVIIILIIRFLISKIFNQNNDTQGKNINETGNIKNKIVEKTPNENGKDSIEKNTEETSDMIDLGNNYSQNEHGIWYKDKLISVDVDTFKVLKDKKLLESGYVVNSENLLKIFADYDTRVLLMKSIDNIIKNKENVTKELKKSSENGMYKIKVDYENLSQYNWNDRYKMSSKQRAKFAIMFLYIKIAKSMPNSDATMEYALKELKHFIENFDKRDLEKEKDQKDLRRIRGNIGIDQHCIYKNGKLYACMLDNLFIK